VNNHVLLLDKRKAHFNSLSKIALVCLFVFSLNFGNVIFVPFVRGLEERVLLAF
jgi:hypothetical protein